MIIRHAEPKDLNSLSEIENECFPVSEACSHEQMKERLKTYPDHFWLLEDNGKIISFVDGMVTEAADLTDEMYEDVSVHSKNGTWLMILGVNTDPGYRHHGYASLCLKEAYKQALKEKLYGIVLTCKEELVSFYEKQGYRREEVSSSVHGGVRWIQMRLLAGLPVIRTRSLILHQPRKEDAEQLYKHLLFDQKSAQYMDWKPSDSLQKAESFLQNYIALSQTPNQLLYIIDEKDGDSAIGFAGFKYNGQRIYEENGIAIGPDYTGKGYGGDILDAFLFGSFQLFEGKEFIYGCLQENIPSIHLAESRGFCLKERNILHFKKDNTDHPHYTFVRFSSDDVLR